MVVFAGSRNGGRIIGLDRGQVAIESIDFDGRQLSRAALRQCGGANVPCQHVRIAVHAKRGFLLWIGGIVPSTGWKLNDAATDGVSDSDARQTGAACVDQADDV